MESSIHSNCSKKIKLRIWPILQVILILLLSSCTPSTDKPITSHIVTLQEDSTKLIQLLSVKYDKLPQDLQDKEDAYATICRQLLLRREVDLLVTAFTTSKDSFVRYYLAAMVLFQIDDQRIEKAFEVSLDEGGDLDSYFAAQYVAERGNLKALEILNRHYFQYGISSWQWSYSIALFGKYGFRKAIPNLVDSLDAASLNVVDAAFDSLQALYPDSPRQFNSLGAAQKYYKGRMESEFGKPSNQVVFDLRSLNNAVR
jgi:hypothetical protein